MEWWVWVLGGFALLAVELATPGGFFTVFFAAGALVVGGLLGMGLALPAWLQWLLFSVLSVGSLAAFRRRLLGRLESTPDTVDSLVGETAVLLDDLARGDVGRAELRGTAWQARTDAPEALRKGQRVRVERVAGLVLWVGREP
jgi:membrane protein implicated in regulation of membrane protease activity